MSHPFLKVTEEALSIFGKVEILDSNKEITEVKISGFENKLKNVIKVQEMLEPFSIIHPIIKKYDVDEGKFHLILGLPKEK